MSESKKIILSLVDTDLTGLEYTNLGSFVSWTFPFLIISLCILSVLGTAQVYNPKNNIETIVMQQRG